MTMKRVQIRLSQETLDRLDWLTEHLDIGNRSTMIRLAVAEMYDRRRTAWLVAQGKGRWALVDGAGREVASCGQRVVERLPAEIRHRLQQEGMAVGPAVGALLDMLPMLEQEGIGEQVIIGEGEAHPAN